MRLRVISDFRAQCLVDVETSVAFRTTKACRLHIGSHICVSTRDYAPAVLRDLRHFRSIYIHLTGASHRADSAHRAHPDADMEICTGSALAISATIFEFETINDCIIFSNMQTDPFTRDISSFCEIESTASIGGCVATTAMATTTPTTTTKRLLLADLFGGG